MADDDWYGPFDPEGSGYDTNAAVAAGIRPDATGHWQSRIPETGLLLKGRGHETWPKTVAGEEAAGMEIYQKDGRYYSRPQDPGESWSPQDEYPYGPAVQKGMQQMQDQFGHLANPMPAAPPAPPPGSMGSLLNPGYQPSQGLTPASSTPEVRSYTPTAREALSQRLQGDAPTPAHRGAVQLLTGSGGLGEGVGAIDFLPFGGSVGAQSAAQGGDYQDAAVNLMPGGKAAKKGAKAATEVIGEVANLVNPKLRAKADKIRGTYGHYANEYPETGPPELIRKLPDPDKPGKFLDKGGKPVPYSSMEEALEKDATPEYFLEKKLTPAAEKFQKDRNTILKDMQENGYEKYFDPDKRFDVDPKHYGPWDDTGVEAKPKTASVEQEWFDRYGTPEARARLQEGYRKGGEVKDSENWYFMGQLEQEYIKHLGETEGRAAFKREFADMMAATTGGQSPQNNWLMAQYANYMTKKGERLPERAYELPFPIGGRFARGNIKEAQEYIDAGQVGFKAAENPKRYDFSSAYQGNPNAFVMDEQMMNAIEPGQNIPQWYGPATRVGREEAAAAGVNPRGFQDKGWAGLKAAKEEKASTKPTSLSHWGMHDAWKPFEYEGPMINQINQSVEVTHRLTGMPREEVVRLGVILKKIPMYAVPGLLGTGAIMGGVADQSKYKPEERM